MVNGRINIPVMLDQDFHPHSFFSGLAFSCTSRQTHELRKLLMVLLHPLWFFDRACLIERRTGFWTDFTWRSRALLWLVAVDLLITILILTLIPIIWTLIRNHRRSRFGRNCRISVSISIKLGQIEIPKCVMEDFTGTHHGKSKSSFRRFVFGFSSFGL